MTTEIETAAVALTDYEKALLIIWPTNYKDAESEKADNASWVDVADLAKATSLKQSSVKGILASLVKKGLAEGGHEKANGVPGDLQVLTDAGIDAAFALRADEAEATETLKRAASAPKPKSTKPAPAPKAETEVKLGSCARIHQLCEQMKGQPRSAILKACEAEGLHKSTIRIQTTKWAKKQPGGWEWPEETPAD